MLHINLIKTSKVETVQDFFVQVGHETYQNDEQSRQKLGPYLENKVPTLKIKVFENNSLI